MKLTKLVSATGSECLMMAELLKKEGILYEIHDENGNAYFSSYGAEPLSGEKGIFIDEADVVRAKEILGLNNEFEKKEKRKIPLWIRITAMLFLLPFIYMVVMLAISTIHGPF